MNTGLHEGDDRVNDREDLRKLREENARLKDLLTRKCRLPLNPLLYHWNPHKPELLSPPGTKYPFSAGCFGGGRMFFPGAGSPPGVRPAILLLAQMSGSPESAINPG